MKRIICFLLCIAMAACLFGCVPQSQVDALSADLESQIEKLESQLEQANKNIADLESDKSSLQGQLGSVSNELETALGSIADLESQLADANGQIDELKNGPDRSLAAVRNAYDAEQWKEVISLANALHAKYPGMDQDIEAQALAAAAQKTLDDIKAKEEAEAAKTMEDKVHSIIRITKLSCSTPNSAGGVGINLHFKNMDPEKTIKYLYVSVYPYNAVGDLMDCEIRGYSRYTCGATGPFAPGKGIDAGSGWWWPNAWYNSTIRYIELCGVRIEYTDGTYITLSSQELQYAIW